MNRETTGERTDREPPVTPPPPTAPVVVDEKGKTLVTYVGGGIRYVNADLELSLDRGKEYQVNKTTADKLAERNPNDFRVRTAS